jgi:hypothetical protein
MAAIAKPPGRSAARVVPRPRREPSAVARGEGKDCLAKAPRCQQIARSAASKSENDSMELLSS